MTNTRILAISPNTFFSLSLNLRSSESIGLKMQILTAASKDKMPIGIYHVFLTESQMINKPNPMIPVEVIIQVILFCMKRHKMRRFGYLGVLLFFFFSVMI